MWGRVGVSYCWTVVTRPAESRLCVTPQQDRPFGPGGCDSPLLVVVAVRCRCSCHCFGRTRLAGQCRRRCAGVIRVLCRLVFFSGSVQVGSVISPTSNTQTCSGVPGALAHIRTFVRAGSLHVSAGLADFILALSDQFFLHFTFT